MRRPVLVTLVVLGSLISLMGSTGLFAALTDTAQTGLNSADSAGLSRSADIQLATAPFGFPVACGAFSEDLTTPLITAPGLEPGDSSTAQLFCIKNVGSQPVSISVTAIELSDLDIDCTGDEAEYDVSCGLGQAGEVSTVLSAVFIPVNCTVGGGSGFSTTVAGFATGPIPLGADLAVGAIGCYQSSLSYPSGVPILEVQAAQSDTVTWRFQFIGDAS